MSTVPDLRGELQAALEGRYTLERELGRGGMGSVYLARDLALDRLVAFKILPPELAVRPELRERFLRETRTAASFSHPNIVPVHAVEQSAQLLYFVMGYVDGETLGQRVRRQGPLPVPDAVRLLQEVAWALSYAHGRGVVHRDVKPDNILIERATGRALVTDFGIARSLSASSLTQVGETVGTPHFMSPEQAAGDQLDGRSDLYSLGVVAYFAVSGRLPFEGDSAQAILAMHLSKPAAPIVSLRPDLPHGLATVIDRCLAKTPEARYPSGEALVEALEGVAGRQREIPPPIRSFLSKADAVSRNGVILAVITPQMIRGPQYGARSIILGSILLAGVASLLAQVPVGMRQLAYQGFTYDDLRNGVLAVDEEQAAAAAALRAAPDAPARARRRRRITLFLAAASILLLLFALSQRRSTAEGRYEIGLVGFTATLLGICIGMATLIFTIAAPARSMRINRNLHGLWTGALGRWLFRTSSRGVGPRDGTAPGGSGSMPTIPGTRILLEQLPSALRRQLSPLRVELERLEAEVERLTRRDRDLETSLNEARQSSGSADPAVEARLKTLLDELEAARRDTTQRRLAVLSTLERIRLALVRLKSGLGSPGDVESLLAESRAMGAGT